MTNPCYLFWYMHFRSKIERTTLCMTILPSMKRTRQKQVLALYIHSNLKLRTELGHAYLEPRYYQNWMNLKFPFAVKFCLWFNLSLVYGLIFLKIHASKYSTGQTLKYSSFNTLYEIVLCGRLIRHSMRISFITLSP